MGTPLYPKDLGTEWMKLKTDVKNATIQSGRKTPFEKIGAGILKIFDKLEVQAGGIVEFLWSTGVIGLTFGRHTTGGEDADGVFIRRPDGTVSFWTYNRVSDGYGYTAIYDQSDNVVLGDDGGSGKGLARPWIPITFGQTSELTNPPAIRRATTTSDTTVYSTIAPMQHSHIHFYAYMHPFTGGATAEVKFKNITNGTTMYAVTTGAGYLESTFALGDYEYGEQHQIDVTIRRVAGTGDVGLTLLSVEGRQTP